MSVTRAGLFLAAMVCLMWVQLGWADTYEAPLDVRPDGEAKLVKKPTAARADDGAVEISFAVSAATEVEVAVLDAKGKVVRHLAAGLLGEHAPPPLQKGALKQKLLWDDKDDLGTPAGKGPFKVRVRIGARAKLEKLLGHDGNTVDPVRGLAVSDTGELYVLTRSWVSRGRVGLVVFGPDGRYRRALMPYSAKVPPKRTQSVGHLVIDGQRLPVVYSGHAHSLHPLTTGLPQQTMAWNPKGHLVVVSTLGTAFEHGLPRHLLAFHPQGGAPEGVRFVGPELRPPTGIMWGHGEGDDPCFDHVACSPGGKYIYYTHSTYGNRHAVFRLHWGEDNGSGMEAAFIGEDHHPGGDAMHLNDPQGLATDPAGRIYVCDRGNDRVAVFSPKGELIGQFAVDDPEQIAVHPKTGEIYLITRQSRWGGPPKDIGPISMDEYRRWKQRRAERQARIPKRTPPKLLKFSAWAKGKPPKGLAQLDENISLFALDPTADPPRLWASVKYRVVPIIDKGDKFEPGEAINSARGLIYPGYIQADPARNRALVQALSSKYTTRSVDLTTGEKKTFLQGTSDVALARDGSIVTTSTYNRNELLRFGPDGKPANWPGSDSHVVKIQPYRNLGLGLGIRGLTVAPNGDIYFLRNSLSKGVQNRVDVFSPRGKLKRAALVDGMGIGDCGIGVDAAGNIYVGANVKPLRRLYQDGFDKLVPQTRWLCWAQGNWHYRPHPWYWSMRNEYLYHWGAVFKFSPEGGAFFGRGSLEFNRRRRLARVAQVENAPTDAPAYKSGYLEQDVKVVGAQWRYPGMGIVPASERLWGDPACVCMTSRLAVDPYGRVFLPNCFRFCVEVLDANGNRLARIGRYGNADDKGLHFAWPAFVDVADGKLYVSDSVNRRLTVVRFEYADQAEVAVK